MRLGGGRALRGRVRDDRQRPVAGAEVSVTWLDAPAPVSGSSEERRVQTDAGGNYQLDHLAPGRKAVHVRAPGLENGLREPVLVSANTDPPNLDFILGPGRDVTGQVLEAGTGLPVGEAWVRAQPATSGPDPAPASASGVSAADGSFRLLGLGERDYLLVAGAAGYGVSPSVPARGGAEGVAISLPVLAVLAGRVTDAETGEPVTAFAVLASPLEELTGTYSGVRQAFEDPSGAFELRGVSEGLQHVFVLAPGYAPGRSRPLRVGRGEYLGGVEVSLTRGVALTGRVLGADGGPAAGVTCLLVGDLPAPKVSDGPMLVRSFRPVRQEARTQEDGSFLFTGVAPGIYTVEARPERGLLAPGGSEVFSVAGDGRRELPDLILRRAAGLEGMVRDRFGRPDPGAVVAIVPVDAGRAAQVTAVTDAEGNFQALGLPPGTYRVLLLRSGGETVYRSLSGAAGADTNLTTLVEGVVKRIELGDG